VLVPAQITKCLSTKCTGRRQRVVRLRLQQQRSEVRSVLQALAPHIAKCTADSRHARAVGNALRWPPGLQQQALRSNPVLQALAPHIAKCTETLDAQDCWQCLFGLKGCSSEHSEVRSVLQVLAPQIAKCTETLTATGYRLCFVSASRVAAASTPKCDPSSRHWLRISQNALRLSVHRLLGILCMG